MGGRVLVLNATYEPINVCTVRRAVVLLLKQKAELLERSRFFIFLNFLSFLYFHFFFF